MTDALECIHRIRVEFKRLNLEPPTTILLADHEEGMRFLSSVMSSVKFAHFDANYNHPVEMADGTVWMEVKVMGMSVRWPASKMAHPNGDWFYV